MLFDLNIDVKSHNNEKDIDTKMEFLEGSGTNTELSGTSSTSSIVNTTADESAVSNEFNFFHSNDYITHQLFPMGQELSSTATNEKENELDFDLLRVGSSQPSNLTHNQWLNLGVSGSGSGSEQQMANNKPQQQQQVKRSRRGPRSRSSQYRGVTFYRRTGRWESHIWDCGKQVYLGGFDTAHAAARAYDRAAIKFRGVDADINFNVTDYDEDMKQMKNLNKEEFVHILRRQSTGFSRGSSRYRGVTLHKCGRWEARMGQFLGKKAYDKAAIQCNGKEAVTNFEPSSYEGQIPLQAYSGGEHNLDLNLGISITIDGPKASSNMEIGESQAHLSHLQLANGKRPMNVNSTYSPQGVQTLYGQPLVSRQSTNSWSGIPPGRSGTYEDIVSDKKVEAVSSVRSLSNWAWYMQSQGQGQGGGGGGGSGGTVTNQVQLLSSAASSGFSFSNATPSSTSFPSSFTNHQTHLHSSNSFHHYGPDR